MAKMAKLQLESECRKKPCVAETPLYLTLQDPPETQSLKDDLSQIRRYVQSVLETKGFT